ncbi:hypothetical protein J8L98_17480 [Pseudoalteromonas sp. MMG013]|uniref:hypothetical protein n=1 Tax=Pseudoalteromonas sp. MMG013 TaxID=2822687 RepID=UPI001B37BC72|nr:hypothetical protein [Pseudoalteromonas sp. MMG013]MBQ4863476.1 hypothetical protein [Pseudoalteromonas sp. MMG013]
MHMQREKPQENQCSEATDSIVQKKCHVKQARRFVNRWSNSITQRRLHEAKENNRPMQMMGNNDSNTIVQRMGYEQKDGSTIYSELKEDDSVISFEGAIRDSEQQETAISARLAFNEMTIPLANVQAGLGFLDRKFKSTTALNIQTLDATPRGRKIGQILTFHLAERAKNKGVPYVIAGGVSDARTPFYTPLGFKDMLNAPPWVDLVQEKAELENELRKELSKKQSEPLLKRHQEISKLMESNRIYIAANDLSSNSKSKMDVVWNTSLF